MRMACGALALLLGCLALAGQDVPVAEPHTMGAFYYLDQDTEGLIALPRELATRVTHAKMHGFGGSEAVFSMPGARCSVRLPYGKPGVFPFAVEPGTNPLRYVQFFQLDRKKDSRELVDTQSSGGRTVTVMNRAAVRFRIARYGNLSFKVVTEGPLSPGEYALSTPTSNVTYCFGVDEPGDARQK